MVLRNQEEEIMSVTRTKYDEEFKKNAVKLSYASPKTTKQIAEDLGIHENMLYNWRKKYGCMIQNWIWCLVES